MSDQMVIKKKPLWRRILRWIVFTGVGLFVLVLVARSVWNYVATKQLKQEIARIRAAGEPLTFKEMDADLSKVDEADDAGRYYAAGLALHIGRKSDELRNPWDAYFDAARASPTSRPSEDMILNADKIVEANKPALEMFDRAADRASYYFDMSVDLNLGARLEHLARIRSMVRLLSLRTHRQIDKGDADAAVDSIVCALRAGRICDRRPVSIVYLVKVACVSVACEDVRTLLERSRPNDESLIGLQQELAGINLLDDMSRMMMGERIYMLKCMNNVVAGSLKQQWIQDEGTPAYPQWPVSFETMPWLRHYTVKYLREFPKFLDAMRRPWPQLVDTIAKDDFTPENILAIPNPLHSLRLSIVLTGRAVAQIRSAQVAVMIERYRRARGKIPAALEDLVPAYAESLPLDPFTEKDLLYSLEDTGYVVYSVGDDLKDDGGRLERLQRDGDSKQQPDWGIRIRRLPKP
ncbi:MAG: hypothetical protein JSV03_07375 [Planctomycetota bacterium]|nr:MAG: hypothetical protein JSV03_07375 [Planctomycetota bacterium]